MKKSLFIPKCLTQSYHIPGFVSAVRVMLILMACLFLITGCKKETDPTPAGSITAKAGSDQSVQVGQTITLDGSASADSDGNPITYLWTIVRKPAKSLAQLSDPASSKPTVEADETGEYEFELTVSSANGKSTDRVMVSASAAEPLAITGNITVRTTLVDRIANPDLPDYIVTTSIDVTNELTINPGVVIAFERDVRMTISDGGGVLIAKGTAAQGIKLIGAQNSKGFWVGITLNSGSSGNAMEYVEVRNAGSRTAYSTTKAALCVAGSSKAQISLKNCHFTKNDSYGIYVYEGGILREFSQNAFSANSEAGILLDAMNVAKLDAASTFTAGNGLNNDRNVVEVTSSTISGKNEVVWSGFADKTPYRIHGILGVDAGFKLAPGVIMEMNRDALIQINETGYLNAKGTPTQKVIFTSADRTAAYWRGIISYSPDTKNELENAEVNNAGSSSIVSGRKANIAVWGTHSTIKVTKTHISGGGGYGVFVGYGSSGNTDLGSANTFDNNILADVFIDK